MARPSADVDVLRGPIAHRDDVRWPRAAPRHGDDITSRNHVMYMNSSPDVARTLRTRLPNVSLSGHYYVDRVQS